jgi:hypothetical protein
MADQTSDASTLPPREFHQDLGQAVQALRGSLIELLATVPGLPERPYPMGRFLGIDKNLAWRVVQLVQTSDPAEAVRRMPGQAGFGRLLEALETRAVPSQRLADVRQALGSFERMVALHAGNRASLESMLGSLAPEQLDAGQLQASRKLAFRGNAATLGVQVRTHFALHLVAPGEQDATQIDVATVGGLIGFRRLRPDIAWPLMRTRAFPEESGFHVRALSGKKGPPLLEPFCTHAGVDLVGEQDERDMTWSVPAGPVGQTAESDWVFGLELRGLGSVYADEDEQDGLVEFQYRISTPAEIGVYDLLVHRDLPFEGPPQSEVFGLMNDTPSFPFLQHAKHVIPTAARLEDLGTPAMVATKDIPRYREMVDVACEEMGWSPEAFRGYRLTLSHPPIPAAPVMAYAQLSPPPGAPR